MTITLAVGFIAGAFYIASHCMKTMVPLRICEIAANVLFVVYGALYPSWPTLVMYAVLVPLNSLRLYEMLQLVKKVRASAQGDLSMEWLKPFMHKHSYEKGEVLFRKGEHADKMFYIVAGACRVAELGLDLHAGQLVGEMGFLTPGHLRTQTVECTEDVEMLTISYEKLTELYFQNPTFGYYFLKLTSERLLDNVKRLELELAARPKPAV